MIFRCELSEHEYQILDTLENPSPETLRELGYNLGEDFNTVLDQLHKLLLDSYVKKFLNLFQVEYYNTMEHFLNENSSEIGGFIAIFKDVIPSNFKHYNKHFTVESITELNRFMSTLNISFILLNDARQQNNIEFLFEAYFNLCFKLENQFKISEKIANKYNLLF